MESLAWNSDVIAIECWEAESCDVIFKIKKTKTNKQTNPNQNKTQTKPNQTNQLNTQWRIALFFFFTRKYVCFTNITSKLLCICYYNLNFVAAPGTQKYRRWVLQCSVLQGNSLSIPYTTSSPGVYMEVAFSGLSSGWSLIMVDAVCAHRRDSLAQIGYGLSNIDTSELEGIVKGGALTRISKEVCGRSANTLNSDLLGWNLCPSRSPCLPLSTLQTTFYLSILSKCLRETSVPRWLEIQIHRGKRRNKRNFFWGTLDRSQKIYVWKLSVCQGFRS